MDWKIFISTFITIFIAEIGDKTQFSAMAIASESKSFYSVLLAVVLALSLAGLLGVMAGSVLGKFVNPAKIKFISGPLFILIGVWILSSRN